MWVMVQVGDVTSNSSEGPPQAQPSPLPLIVFVLGYLLTGLGPKGGQTSHGSSKEINPFSISHEFPSHTCGENSKVAQHGRCDSTYSHGLQPHYHVWGGSLPPTRLPIGHCPPRARSIHFLCSGHVRRFISIIIACSVNLEICSCCFVSEDSCHFVRWASQLSSRELVVFI